MKTKFTLIMVIAGFLCAQAQTWTWLEDQLEYARDGLCATVLDDSIFYSGGRLASGVYYNIVEIYDIGEDSWSLVEPPGPDRWQSSAVSANGMVFISGGNDFNANGSWDWYADIDVFNKANGEWTVEYLSAPRAFMGTVAHGNKIFFAGGLGSDGFYSVIDIYDTESGTWLPEEDLSVPRWSIGAVTAGNKVFFAGGITGPNLVTDVVDIYDISNDEWTTEYLSEPRAFIAAMAYGDSVYFAGGTLPNDTGSDVIDIYDVVDEEWKDTKTLSGPRIVFADKVYDALVFTGWCDYFSLSGGYAGNTIGTVDIYYPEIDSWNLSVPSLDPPRHYFAHASYDNKVYYAGGRLDNGGEWISTINILDYDYIPGFSEDKSQELAASVNPNPFSTTLTIDYSLQHSGIVNISIYNNIGEQVEILMDGYQQQGNQQVIFNAEKLEPGIYFCVLKTNEGIQTTKMIKL